MLGRLLLPRRGLLPGQRGHQRGLIAQVIQGLDEQAIAAGQVQGAVELAVGQAALRLVGGGRRGLQGRAVARAQLAWTGLAWTGLAWIGLASAAPRPTARRTASGSSSSRRS